MKALARTAKMLVTLKLRNNAYSEACACAQRMLWQQVGDGVISHVDVQRILESTDDVNAMTEISLLNEIENQILSNLLLNRDPDIDFALRKIQRILKEASNP